MHIGEPYLYKKVPHKDRYAIKTSNDVIGLYFYDHLAMKTTFVGPKGGCISRRLQYMKQTSSEYILDYTVI